MATMEEAEDLDPEIELDSEDDEDAAAALEAAALAGAAAEAALAAQNAAAELLGDEYEAEQQMFLDGASDFTTVMSTLDTSQAAAAGADDAALTAAMQAGREEVAEHLAAAARAAEEEVQKLAEEQTRAAAADQAREAALLESKLRREREIEEAAQEAQRAKIRQREKEKQVLQVLQECLGGNAMAFGEFKQLSGRFRFGNIDAKAYYIGVERMVGIESSAKLMPLLCEALPDETKRAEFAAVIAQAEKIRARRAAAAAAAEAKRVEEEKRRAAAAKAAAESAAVDSVLAEEQSRRAAAEAESIAAREAAAREEVQRQEAARREAVRQEAARQEAARQEAARQEAARQEAARQEAARREAARQEAARQEAARQEAARREAARQAEAKRRAAASRAAGPVLGSDEDHIARLARFYSFENPSKVEEVDTIFKKHGRKVWKKLVKKYGDRVYEITEGLTDIDLPPNPNATAVDASLPGAGTGSAVVAPPPLPAATAAAEDDDDDTKVEEGTGFQSVGGGAVRGDGGMSMQEHEIVAEVKYLGGTLSITMWGAQDVMDPMTHKFFVEYVLKIQWTSADQPPITWMIPQRYSCFDLLHQVLVDLYRTQPEKRKLLPKLTGKTFFGSSTSEKVKAKRKKGLTAYLQQLFLHIPDAVFTGAVDSFLNISRTLGASLEREKVTSIRPTSMSNASATASPVASAESLKRALPPRHASQLDADTLVALAAGDDNVEAAKVDEDEPLTQAIARELDAKAVQLAELLDNMHVNPQADQVVQSLLTTLRANMGRVRKAAVIGEGELDAELLRIAMQLEEEIIRVERLYSGRVEMRRSSGKW